MKQLIIIISMLFFACAVKAQSVYPGQHEGKIKLPLKDEIKVYAFDLKNVRLLDSPFKQNMERESKWILSIGVDRLLHSFRTSAGVWAGLEGGQRYVVYWNFLK